MATTPKSWTSRTAALLALGALAGTITDADARRGKKKDEPVPEPVVVDEPEPAPVTPAIPLFPQALPFTVGPLVDGLANTTSQACAACHFEAHGGWAESAHATGWQDPTVQAAFRLADTPACSSCHLPLLEQRPTLVTYPTDEVDKPLVSANPAFDPSLRLEGVTCAACHVRNGQVVATRPPEDIGPAPHPLAWSEDLTRSEGCAACHQLTWEGANAPLYDTYGEWSRSPYAEAGIACQDCHGGRGADAAAPYAHGSERRTERAISVLIDLPSLTVVRGDEVPVPLGLTLQNSGAGHAFPTGSPFGGVRVQVRLTGPEDRHGKPFDAIVLEHDLERTLTDAPPWDVTADTRIPARGQLELSGGLSIPYGAPGGAWALEVALLKTVRGEPTDEAPLLTKHLPLAVE